MAERLLRPGARVIADNVLHPGAPLFVNDVKERYDLEVKLKGLWSWDAMTPQYICVWAQ